MAIHDLGHGVRLYTRVEWTGGNPAYNPRGNGTPRRLSDIHEHIVHHSGGATLGDPDVAQWIRNIFNEHVHGRGYYDIAYESMVDEDGNIWEGRNAHWAGAHTANHNLHGFAACLLRAEGDSHEDYIVPGEVKNAYRTSFQMTDYIVQLDGGNPIASSTHKRSSGNSTACPGLDLDTWVGNGGCREPFGKSEPSKPAQPSKPSTPAKPAANWPKYGGTVLSKGSKGKAVKAWQQRLVDLRLEPGPVDGEFGPKTERATRVFQGLRKLKVDGKVGPKSWAEAAHG